MPLTHRRPLSSNELSYFLPSRASGVNDMYLHHRVSTSYPELFDPSRVVIVWALIRQRHPLLAASISPGPSHELDDWEFCHTPAPSTDEAKCAAEASLDVSIKASSQDLVASYLNGPRTLSASHLSHLFVSSAEESEGTLFFDVLLATTHSIGDGMALHTCANELYSLLGGTTLDLESMLKIEVEAQSKVFSFNVLPPSAEARVASPLGVDPTMYRAASRIALGSTQSKAIGAQCLPRQGPILLPQVSTVVPTLTFSVDETTTILSSSRAHGVSLSHIAFALVNSAWIEMEQSRVEQPMLLYSALSLRSSLKSAPDHTPSFFHLALGYYTITLPSFPLPSSTEQFWLRARSVKKQTLAAVKSRFLVGKALLEAEGRKANAVEWARKDDAAAAAAAAAAALSRLSIGFDAQGKSGDYLLTPPPTPPIHQAQFSKALEGQPAAPTARLAVKDTSLLGLSILGDLSPIYSSPSLSLLPSSSLSTPSAGALTIHSLNTGSRQRSGGSLLFAYILGGRLTFSLGFDAGPGGLDEKGMMRLWRGLETVARRELL